MPKKCNGCRYSENENSLAMDILKMYKKRIKLVVTALCIIIAILFGYIIIDAYNDKGDVYDETLDERVSAERSLADEEIRLFSFGVSTLFDGVSLYGRGNEGVRTAKKRKKYNSNHYRIGYV